jgi:hypothetical protein
MVDEILLARLDETTRQLHFKIEAILTQESSTKVKDYVGRLDREFSPHLPFYINGLVKLALHLYKFEIPILETANIEKIKAAEVSLQDFKKALSTADRKKFITLFCSMLVSKLLLI